MANEPPPHFAVNCFPSANAPIFSGPDGLAPYRSHQPVDKQPIGTHRSSREDSSNLEYLWRTPVRSHEVPVHLRPRSSYPAEIGWHNYLLHDAEPYRTGHQKLTSEFWREADQEYTHRYQEPWYPGPGEVPDPATGCYYFQRFPDTPNTQSRIFLSKVSSRASAGTLNKAGASAPKPQNKLLSGGAEEQNTSGDSTCSTRDTFYRFEGFSTSSGSEPRRRQNY